MQLKQPSEWNIFHTLRSSAGSFVSFPVVCTERFVPHAQTFSNLTVTRQNSRGCSAHCWLLGSSLWTRGARERRAAQRYQIEAAGCVCLHCWCRIRALGWPRCRGFSATPAWSAHTPWGSAFLPLLPKAFAFLGEVVVVFLCLLTSTKLPDGISMLCKETGAFYYRGHVDPIHLHSQKWSKAFAHCIGKECSAPSRDPEGLLWDIVALWIL